MDVCIPCRNADPIGLHTKDGEWVHTTCREKLVQAPYRWSPPKKSNTRAWKRIEKGEWLWDRRRVRRGYRLRGTLSDTHITWERKKVLTRFGWRYVPVEGTEREVNDYRRKPREVDLGG